MLKLQWYLNAVQAGMGMQPYHSNRPIVIFEAQLEAVLHAQYRTCSTGVNVQYCSTS